MHTTTLAGGRGWLDAPAAASLARIDAEIGHLLQITDAGRTNAQQWENYEKYLNGGSYAAYPGTSPHEFGNAIDTDERLVDLMARHGWWRPLRDEPWHFVYREWADRHRNDPAPSTPESEEDDMKFMYIDDEGNGRAAYVLLNTRTGKTIHTTDATVANGWAKVWGTAQTYNGKPIPRQEFLNAIDAITKTRG